MNTKDIKANELKIGDVVRFAGKTQEVLNIEPTFSGADLFITLSVSQTGVWGKRDRITVVTE